MAFKLFSDVREASTTTGTGDMQLAGAVTGYKAFSSRYADGDTLWYAIKMSPDFEVGLGTYNSGANTLTRTTVDESTNSDAAVNWGAGTKDIFVGLPGRQGGHAVFTTGDAKLTFKTTADATWIMCNDGSIGNGSSNATTRANADTSALFTLLYNNIAALVVQDSTGSTVSRGANAAADFAANRRLVIPKALGRSIAIAGAGSGLTSRTLGATAGAETETPTLAKTAAHTHTVPASVGTPGSFNNSAGTNDGGGPNTSSSAGSGTALNILDPSTYLNIMIKL